MNVNGPVETILGPVEGMQRKTIAFGLKIVQDHLIQRSLTELWS